MLSQRSLNSFKKFWDMANFFDSVFIQWNSKQGFTVLDNSFEISLKLIFVFGSNTWKENDCYWARVRGS